MTDLPAPIPPEMAELIADHQRAVDSLRRLYGFSEPEAMAFLQMDQAQPTETREERK